jgi:hypothetical protein
MDDLICECCRRPMRTAAVGTALALFSFHIVNEANEATHALASSDHTSDQRKHAARLDHAPEADPDQGTARPGLYSPVVGTTTTTTTTPAPVLGFPAPPMPAPGNIVALNQETGEWIEIPNCGRRG